MGEIPGSFSVKSPGSPHAGTSKLVSQGFTSKGRSTSLKDTEINTSSRRPGVLRRNEVELGSTLK